MDVQNIDRQIDRQKGRQTDTQTLRQTDRQIERQTDGHTEGQTGSQKDRLRDRQIHRWYRCNGKDEGNEQNLCIPSPFFIFMVERVQLLKGPMLTVTTV